MQSPSVASTDSVCLSLYHVESARNTQKITPTARETSSPFVSPDVSMYGSAFSSFSCSSSASSSSSFLSPGSLQQLSPKDGASFESSSVSLVRCPDMNKFWYTNATCLTRRCTCSNQRHSAWNKI
ncbi:hypothetical protein BpHYR1_027742 [Brachionus plicatilis]|uniref:Uncharacterized protein n=1 Tax=Brachionus plicatilis TaxID=10195 RepID=A0A3M7REH5_BRAPC|nr:hypothetical protein BpHYR1_027742 [Brachionus plicatilis]